MAAVPDAPSADKRWKIVATSLRRLGHRPESLIEGMHAVQASFGSLQPAALRWLAETLGVPLSKVYGVATFYHLFHLTPPGQHACVVCLGTVCHLKGGPRILEALSRAHGIGPGETTPGGELSILVARCVGACSLAPVVVIDDEVTGPATPEGVADRVAAFFEEPEGSVR